MNGLGESWKTMFYTFTKRLIDIAISVACIILFSPLMLLVAVYIKVVSPGPILADIPDRLGHFGKPFRLYKFRSMIPNAHQYLVEHPNLYKEYVNNGYKLPNDPRFIPGAIFLRKSSLDELPQFFNVLKGEMGIVGPRAYYAFELEDQQKKYPESRKHVEKLLTAKPGITGPWQVGGRSKISFPERAKLDADYAVRKSILYDFKIMLKTPLAVLQAKGAA